MKMLLAGGGTGGHLFPAVALAQRQLTVEPEAEILFVGTRRGIETRVLPELGYALATIDISGLVNRPLLGKLALAPQLVISVWQSLRILKKFRPDVVVGVGGYASGPVLLAAKLLGYPTLIHEQNAALGFTNRVLGRWVDRVCISFPEMDCALKKSRTMITGNPLRSGMENCPPLPGGEPHLLIFGGSRGARAINDAVVAMLPHLERFKDRLTIRHQTGEEDLERIRQGYRAAGWDDQGVVPFIVDMAEVYARSHLVICRAGATTLAELTACGRPAILIPYPHAAADHQTANAQALASRGAALMLPQTELNGKLLARLAGDLLEDPERLSGMAGAAWAMGKRGAADRILEACRALAGTAETTTNLNREKEA